MLDLTNFLDVGSARFRCLGRLKKVDSPCALSTRPDEPFGHTPMSPLGTSECALSAHPIYTETTAENTAKITYTVQQAALGIADANTSQFNLEE